MNIVWKNNDKLQIGKLSENLGCPVVEISALKCSGNKEAAEKAVASARQKNAVSPVHEFAPEVESVLNAIEDKIASYVPEEQRRFFAVKLMEKDEKIAAHLKHVPDVT